MSRREGKKGDRGDMPFSLHGNNWKSSTSLPLTFYWPEPTHTTTPGERRKHLWAGGQVVSWTCYSPGWENRHQDIQECWSLHASPSSIIPLKSPCQSQSLSFQSWAQSHLLLKTFPDCLQPRATCLLLQPHTVFINNRIAQPGGLYRLEWPVTNLRASFFFLKKIANFLEGPSPCCLLFQMPT